MAYQDTILEICAVKILPIGTNILLPALCDVSRNSERKVIHASGQRKAYNVFPGNAEITGSIKDFPLAVDLEDILDCILSDANTGKMKEVEIDDGDSRYTGYLTSLKISIPVHDTIMCSIDWTANSFVTPSTLVKAPIVLDAFIGTGVSLTGFPSTFDFESVDITLKNNLTAKYSAKGTSRLPTHLAQGYFDAEVNIKFNEDPGIDVLGDALAKLASATIVAKSISGTKTFTITLTNLIAGDSPRNMNAEDIVDFGLVYNVSDVSFKIE